MPPPVVELRAECPLPKSAPCDSLRHMLRLQHEITTMTAQEILKGIRNDVFAARLNFDIFRV
jgi:hypothetical protein